MNPIEQMNTAQRMRDQVTEDYPESPDMPRNKR